jgi:hypothetical protein
MAALDYAAPPELEVPPLHRDWICLALDSSSPTICPPAKAERSTSGTDLSPGNGIVQLVAGSFATEVIQIWSGHRITEYLTATDTRRHLWHACLSSERLAFRVNNRMSAELAYARLTYVKGRDLIDEAYACYPLGVMKALGRLGAAARSPRVYRALIQALCAEGAGAKLLWHSSHLSDEIILGVSLLPSGLKAQAVLDLFKEGKLGIEAVGFFTWTLARIDALKGSHVAQEILAAAKPLEALWEALADFPFPAPPWPGKDLLRPVTSRADLERIGSEFENCLSTSPQSRGAVQGVINGVTYFYEWRGQEHAVLEFCRVGSVGWFLREVRGPKNQFVSDQTRSEIRCLLSEAPTLCAVWDCDWQYEVVPLLG